MCCGLALLSVGWGSVGSLTLADAKELGAGRREEAEHGGTGSATPAKRATGASAEARIGERLFLERRFAQAVAVATGRNVNVEPAKSAMSCATCHVPPGAASSRAFCDDAPRSAIPERGDGRHTTPRNSPTLVEALAGPAGALLHYDGEFATPEALVAETYVGRNFGWLPGEHADARRHFARVIREDDGRGSLAQRFGGKSYATLLRGTAASIPEGWRLPPSARIDPTAATDEQIVAACAQLVVAYLQTLGFSRDANGAFNGSPYDAFLVANRLPQAPAAGETPREYARRLGELIASLKAPRFIDEPARARAHGRSFRFGETELRGLRAFFKAAVGNAQHDGAGNCAECHVPPQFTDFKFHNTGAAQDEYDALHGAGSFARLTLPSVDERSAEYDRWLQPTPAHPGARGVFASPAAADAPGRADLGVWNVYANPDLPAPQPALERIANPAGLRTRAQVLSSLVATFKTPGLRGLGESAPYLHTGRAATLDDVVRFYRRMSELAHVGRLRNAPPEFFAMRLGESEPLVAFLRSLDEDFGEKDN